MDILCTQRKLPKSHCARQINNDHGLEVRLHNIGKATPLVGFIVVTEELKHDYKGYLGRCTHEEFKAGALQKLSWDFLNAPTKLPDEVEEVLK